MATSFTKTYQIQIKYSRDDGATLTDSDLEAEQLRNFIKKKIAEVVPVSRGILSAHISGTVSES